MYAQDANRALVLLVQSWNIFGESVATWNIMMDFAAEHLTSLRQPDHYVCIGDEDKGMKKAWETHFPMVRSTGHWPTLKHCKPRSTVSPQQCPQHGTVLAEPCTLCL